MSLSRATILCLVEYYEAAADEARLAGNHQLKADLRAIAFDYRRMLEHAK